MAIKKMQKRMSVRQDLTTVENKVDVVLDTVNEIREEIRTQTVMISQLPTKSDMEDMLERTYDLATLTVKYDKIREVLREKLHVEI